MPPEGLAIATAEGELQRTPLAHLLVYAMDHRLSGAMFLTDPARVEHVIRLEQGAPVKVGVGDGYAKLGELLVEGGFLSPQTLAEALATKGLLGDVLLVSGCVDVATLEGVAESQLMKRMVHLFGLPAETRYQYFDGYSVLDEWGCEPTRVDPLAILWAGLREHGECSSLLQPMLERLGHAPLRIHPAFVPGRFGFREAELEIVERMQADEPSFAELVASRIASEATLRKLVYALVISRSIHFGTGSIPVGVEPTRASTRAPNQAVGKMQIRSVLHRVGAAAPDPAGDGERPPISPHVRRKKENDGSVDDPPASVKAPSHRAAAGTLGDHHGKGADSDKAMLTEETEPARP